MASPPAIGTGLITVGDELLGGFTQDTNSGLLARRALELGRPLVRIEIVADDVTEVAAAVRRAVADPRCSRIVVGGGVGPTPDDVTLEGVGLGLDREMTEDPVALELIGARIRMLHAAGRRADAEISAANRRMAWLPTGAVVHGNPGGMAPLLAYPVEPGGRWLLVLPGVPREFEALLDEVALPTYFTGGDRITVTEVHFSGIPESEFADPMRTLGREFPDVGVGSYPQTQRRELIIRLRGSDAARVAAAAARLEQLRPA